MVDEEIYILTKHAKFQADYIENIPIYRRRHYLFLLQREQEEVEKLRDKESGRHTKRPRK